MRNKNKILTIGIVLITLILAGVAIFTAIRLYQTRNIAPTKSEASGVPSACQLSFNITGPSASPTPTAPPSCNSSCTTNANCPTGFTCWGEEPGAAKVCRKTTCQWSANCVCPTASPTATPAPIVCTNKRVYRDVASNTAGNYNLSSANLLTNNANVDINQKLVFVVRPGPANAVGSVTITDTLSAKVTFIDSDSRCAYTASNRKVTCTVNGPDTANTQVAFRVSVNASATGTISNTAVVQAAGGQPSNCSIAVVVANTPTDTPTPTPTPTSSATPTPTGTPNSCGGTCESNFNCGSELVCYNGMCRNPSCTAESDCVCNGTPAPTATPPTLPQSGTDWPTMVGAGLGILVILGSILLAL